MPPSGANFWAFETRLSSACSSRRRSPNTSWSGPTWSIERRARWSARRGERARPARWSTAARATARNRRSWSEIVPERNRDSSRMSPTSRCIRSPLRTIASSRARALRIGRAATPGRAAGRRSSGSAVSGVRSSWEIVERRSVRSASRSTSRAAALVVERLGLRVAPAERRDHVAACRRPSRREARTRPSAVELRPQERRPTCRARSVGARGGEPVAELSGASPTADTSRRAAPSSDHQRTGYGGATRPARFDGERRRVA